MTLLPHYQSITFFIGFSGRFLLALFIAFSAGCENDIEKVRLVTGKDKLPSEVSTGMVILYSDSARVKVKVQAPKLERFTGDDPYTVLPEGVHVEFYDGNMKVSSTLSSRYAVRKDTQNKMEARNDVVVVNERGEKLNTEHLIWDENAARIYSDEFVKITTADKIIMGDGFEANQDFTQYKIFKIRGTISLEK
jgi:LPS export ABC transporter protein LptC